eukprot:12932154-Prorocentrum_lima.AAC.1
MAQKAQREDPSMLIPWVIPLKEESGAPKAILRTIDLIPIVGPFRGTFGIMLQADNRGELTNEPLIAGCQTRE